MREARALSVLCLLVGCGPIRNHYPPITGLEGLALSDLAPSTWLPHTRVLLSGTSFVDGTLGAPHLALHGAIGGQPTDLDIPVEYTDSGHLGFDVDPDLFGGALGAFSGDAVLLYDSLLDGQTHAAAPLSVTLSIVDELDPRIDQMAGQPLFVNDPVPVQGDGFLLGGAEGETRAVVSGCFQPQGGGTCAALPAVEIPAHPGAPFQRTSTVFPYATRISGIHPGAFHGQVKLRNVLPGGVVRESRSVDVTWNIGPPLLVGVSPSEASLGQYVFFHGGGFVGGEPDEVTLLRVDATFAPADGSPPRAVQVTLVPEFQEGQTVRYVLDEADNPLGVDLRRIAGQLDGTVTPTVRKGSDSLDGAGAHVSVTLGPVKQVVWVRFLDSYVDSLSRFGLRGVDGQIRDRIFEICQRDYQGINIEFRADEPQDFALYSVVDIGGPDPNDLGLFGYDNTPGKDVGNVRLFDHIGGINAQTQDDGYPGYGGIFAEEFLGFSEHPAGVSQLPIHTELFDKMFDPFRPDVGGLEVSGADLDNGGPPKVRDGSLCPSGERKTALGCAIFVLGNLIGTTLTHEVGHSLGLANPYGDGYHDAGDAPNRLMDAGGARPFEERAELLGQGPAVFCVDEYDYLRNTILPGSHDDPPAIDRPACE